MPMLRFFLLGVVLLGLSACASSTPTASSKFDRCVQDMHQLGAKFDVQKPYYENNGKCGIHDPISISAGSVPWNRPASMSCELAQQMVLYEKEVLNPLAKKHFKQPIKRIVQAGTYDCRIRRNASTNGGTSKGGRLSEHAKGRAIDIMAIELQDGTRISIKDHWRNAGTKTKFLREASQASCRYFKVVLSPNHDKYHQDHWHFDIGPWPLCKA